ncbi:MAG: hypothetical protein SF187_26085 [Deltaproteobacteria bacterium]|nr:hypothetical protein [Deltaproteobacteria bacterium]
MSSPAPIRVLLIGNSHTHVNNVPALLQKVLVWGTGRPVTCLGCTTDSVSLQWHWNHHASRRALDAGPYDFVVLQDRSGAPLEDPHSTRTYAGLWCDAVKHHNAEPVLYMTWALADAPQTQRQISMVYDEVAAAHGAHVAPVGLAWQRAGYMAHKPALYDPDGRHAAPAGSFLAAAVVAQTIAPDVSWRALREPPPVFASLSPEQVLTLMSVAAQTILARLRPAGA